MKRVIITLILVATTCFYSFSQNGWTQVADYPGSGSAGLCGYNFLNTGLAGFGYYNYSTNNFGDIWEYNAINDTWTARAPFPGTTRYGQSGFSLGKLAYICLGSDGVGYFNDMWEYDGSSNTWTQKASFTGSARYGAIAQGGGGTKAYVGAGEHDYGNGYTDYCADFYEYDQPSNTWTQKTAFPGQPRFCAFSFLIDNMVFVVGGRTETFPYSSWIYLNDMYAYDIATDTWTQKASYPGQGGIGIGGFVLGQYAYLGTGYANYTPFSDFWKYDPQADTWLQLADFPGGARGSTMWFNIGNYGFLGCGGTGSNYYYDFWRYEDPTVGTDNTDMKENIKLYPIPANDFVQVEGNNIHYIEICTAMGSLVKHQDVSVLQNKIPVDISALAPGFYYAKISLGKNIITKKIIKD